MIYSVDIPAQRSFSAWREAARIAISHDIAPADIDWNGGGGLFAGSPLPDIPGAHQISVTQAFLKLAGSVIWHSAPERFALLYQALWRLYQRDGDPISQADELGRKLNLMAKSVGRDIHKMHAFVRFRELPSDQPRRRFAAWFEPEHYTLEPGSRFFAKRFADMDWMIATPHLTARFEDGELSFHAGGARPTLPEDASEALWGTYFANIFNPARIKLNAMRSEMPKKYWKNLPETRLIPEMLKDAEARVERMRAATASEVRPGAAAISTRYRASMPKAVGLPNTLAEARESALQCRRCGLCETATQTVWGEGAGDASLMIVGEQPGDREDLEGRPFIGPAGQLLRLAMAEAGVSPERVWLTNAVKHFKFTMRGKKRIHQNPGKQEIQHCQWWLAQEINLVQPHIILALGASAAFALTGHDTSITSRRGQVEPGIHGGPVLITWHPSYILRLPDTKDRKARQRELVNDISAARLSLRSSGGQ